MYTPELGGQAEGYAPTNLLQRSTFFRHKNENVTYYGTRSTLHRWYVKKERKRESDRKVGLEDEVVVQMEQAAFH